MNDTKKWIIKEVKKAEKKGDHTISASTLSKRSEVSRQYIQRMLAELVESGIVKKQPMYVMGVDN